MEKTNQHIRPQENMTLEDNIMACWGIVNEINLLNEAVQDQEIDRDSIANILLGLEYLYELKFQKLMSSYRDSIQIPIS